MIYFSEFIRYLRDAKTSSILMISSLVFSMLLTIFALTLALLSERIEAKVLGSFSIDLFLDSGDGAVIKDLKNNLALDNKISSMVFIKKSESEEKFINETGIDFKKVLNFNPLPEKFTLKIKSQFLSSNSLPSLKAEYENYSGVDEVVFRNDDVILAYDKLKGIRFVFFAIATIIFLFSSAFLFMLNKNLIRLRQQEIKVMKLVGSPRRIIVLPLVLYNLFVGLLSSSIVIAVISFSFILLNKTGLDITFVVLNTIHYLLILTGGVILPIILLFFQKEFSSEIPVEI